MSIKKTLEEQKPLNNQMTTATFIIINIVILFVEHIIPDKILHMKTVQWNHRIQKILFKYRVLNLLRPLRPSLHGVLYKLEQVSIIREICSTNLHE